MAPRKTARKTNRKKTPEDALKDVNAMEEVTSPSPSTSAAKTPTKSKTPAKTTVMTRSAKKKAEEEEKKKKKAEEKKAEEEEPKEEEISDAPGIKAVKKMKKVPGVIAAKTAEEEDTDNEEEKSITKEDEEMPKINSIPKEDVPKTAPKKKAALKDADEDDEYEATEAALKDADEDVDDEYDKATDAIIRKMARENLVETQQNARDIQALKVGHNELVRKVEEHGHQLSGLTHQVNNLQTVVADTVSVVRDDHDTLKWLIQTVKGLSDSIMNLCLFGREVGEETAALRNDVDRISGGIRALAFAVVALFGAIFSWYYVYQQKEE